MCAKIEEAIKELLDSRKETLSMEFLKKGTSVGESLKREKIIRECLDMTSDKNKVQMENNIDELLSLNISYEDYLYARGVLDGIKILSNFIN